MIRKIFKTGHSVAITLSKNFLKDLGLKVGDTVRMETNSDNSGLIIRRGKKDSQLSLELKVRPKL
jgi:antitoxin component of MazEF toxin-antitoxin module